MILTLLLLTKIQQQKRSNTWLQVSFSQDSTDLSKKYYDVIIRKANNQITNGIIGNISFKNGEYNNLRLSQLHQNITYTLTSNGMDFTYRGSSIPTNSDGVKLFQVTLNNILSTNVPTYDAFIATMNSFNTTIFDPPFVGQVLY